MILMILRMRRLRASGLPGRCRMMQVISRWVCLHSPQFVITGEQTLLELVIQQLRKIPLKEQRGPQERLHLKGLGCSVEGIEGFQDFTFFQSFLYSIQKWVDKKLGDYHLHFSEVSNSDMKYRKMGIIGTLKVVSTLGDANAATVFSSSQKTNGEEALELLNMSVDSCKSVTLPLIYDELIALLERSTLQPAIVEWIGKHTGEFESLFLADLEEGQLIPKESLNDMEGEIWMNLDGDRSPICVNILPLLSSLQQCSTSLHILSSQFLLLSVVERLHNQGSLEGIDALLGCPLHLPSLKYIVGPHSKKLTAKENQIMCWSLYFAINWIRELLNAFSTQVARRIDCVTQSTREDIIAKLLKRLRNLVSSHTTGKEMLQNRFSPYNLKRVEIWNKLMCTDHPV